MPRCYVQGWARGSLGAFLGAAAIVYLYVYGCGGAWEGAGVLSCLSKHERGSYRIRGMGNPCPWWQPNHQRPCG